MSNSFIDFDFDKICIVDGGLSLTKKELQHRHIKEINLGNSEISIEERNILAELQAKQEHNYKTRTHVISKTRTKQNNELNYYIPEKWNY